MEREGYYVFLPYLTSFHVLDKIIQRLDLTWAQTPGSASRDLKLKTSDGSSVSLDISINFKLIPREAVNVLRRSGAAERFAEVWIEPFARHVCLASFGQLTTEEMYDAGRRNDRAQAALRQMNELLEPQGIEVIAMIPGEFRFYQEYEQVIQEKKLADQQVEEQQSQAKALLQDQARHAILLTEAAGLEQRREALRGEGGLNLVGLEYARRLEGVRLIGTLIAREPLVQQFAVQSPDANRPGQQPPEELEASAALPLPGLRTSSLVPGIPGSPPR